MVLGPSTYLGQIRAHQAARQAMALARPSELRPAGLIGLPAMPETVTAERRAVPQMNGLGLTEPEQDRIVEMFLAHSTDGRMGRAGFDTFLLEAIAYSFTTRERNLDCRQHIRGSMAKLARRADTGSPIFEQAWRFFDRAEQGTLGLREVGAGMAQICRPATVGKFMFGLADVDQNGSLSYQEVLCFFEHFIALVLVMATEVLRLESVFLCKHQGWTGAMVSERQREIQSTMGKARQIVAAQLTVTFRLLDSNHDGRISFAEWSAGWGHLPKMYAKVRLVCEGMLNETMPIFKTGFEEDRDEHPEFDDMDVTPEISRIILDMWNHYSDGKAMSQQGLAKLMVEGMAKSFLSRETAKRMDTGGASMVRAAVADGALLDGIDLVNDRLLCYLWRHFGPDDGSWPGGAVAGAWAQMVSI